MRPVLRRIAIHGVFTAVVLAFIGFMFVDLAGVWMSAAARPARYGAKTVAPDLTALRMRAPVLMACWGFLFVAAGELALYRIRKNRTPPPAPPQPDPATKLIEELLAEAEAKAAGATAKLVAAAHPLGS